MKKVYAAAVVGALILATSGCARGNRRIRKKSYAKLAWKR